MLANNNSAMVKKNEFKFYFNSRRKSEKKYTMKLKKKVFTCVMNAIYIVEKICIKIWMNGKKRAKNAGKEIEREIEKK